MGDQPKLLKLMLLTVGLGLGGTEGQVLEIASRLDRARFAVIVCCLKGEGIIARELRERGVRVVALGGRGKFDIRTLAKLFSLIRAERPDVIHAFLFWANLLSRVFGKLLRVPVLISSYRGVDVWKRWHRVLADRVTSRWAQVMTCCSDAVRRVAFSQVLGDETKFITIHNGVDVDRFNGQTALTKHDLGLHEDLPVIGTVCRLYEPTKGIAVLLEAVAKLTEQAASPCCQLLIVGEGPAFGKFRDLGVRLGIDRWVVFAGARRDIPRVLPLMEIFVLPSLYEGFGIAIIEAMAAGRPVIATAVGGIPEIVVHGETGLLVPPGDPIALAAAIRSLISDSKRALSFGARGRKRVHDKFSIEMVVRRHEELYERCFALRA